MSATSVGSVFISYARADRLVASRLTRSLRAAGLVVRWDADLVAGMPWEAQVEEAIRESEAFALLSSSRSVRSRRVRQEALFASGLDETPLLLLVRLDEAALPAGLNLAFGSTHRVDLPREGVSAVIVALGQEDRSYAVPVGTGSSVVLKKVWHRSEEKRTSELLARQDVGRLTFRTASMEYDGVRSGLVVIEDLQSVTYGRQGSDWFNSWVRVDYVDDGGLKRAYFRDGRWLGWRGVVGGNRKVLREAQRILAAGHTPSPG